MKVPAPPTPEIVAVKRLDHLPLVGHRHEAKMITR